MGIDPGAVEAYEKHANDLVTYATALVGPSDAEDVDDARARYEEARALRHDVKASLSIGLANFRLAHVTTGDERARHFEAARAVVVV